MQVLQAIDDSRFWQQLQNMDFSAQLAARDPINMTTKIPDSNFDIRISRMYRQTGQQWLRVTDNGVGMTEEVIQNYFTQIGKN